MSQNEQEIITSLIQSIEDAETPASVTNAIVARILKALNSAGIKLSAISEGGILKPDIEIIHNANSVEIKIPTILADGTAGLPAKIIIEAAKKKAGMMSATQANRLEHASKRIDSLPILPYSGIAPEGAAVSPSAPGRVALTAAVAADAVGVVYREAEARFVLRLATGGAEQYFATWPEVADTYGNALFPSSADYTAGKLFADSSDGEALSCLVTEGDSVRLVPVGDYDWLLERVGAVAEGLGLHASRLERHHERLSELDESVDELRGNLQSAAVMALNALNRSEDNASAIEELQEGLGSAKGSDPLPFVFVRNETILPQGVVAFSRDSNAFFFEGDGEMPQGYDETLPDGSVRPSTSARFVCGNVVYRFTGSQMVNTAIEADANRRLVRRMPSTTSHPGLAYIDRGRIRVPLPYPEPDAEFRVSLKGMFIDNRGWGGAQPLIPLSQMVPSGQGVEDLRIEDDSIVGTFANAVPDFVRVCLCCPGVVKDGEVPDPDGRHNWDGGKNHFIGVRFDDKGRKIFYRFDSAFPANDIPIPTLGDAEELLRVSTEGPPGLGFSLWRRWGDFQVQVWRRRRNYISKRVVWKWINIPEDGRRAVRMRRCLVRMRRANRSGISPWAYFNVNSEGEITVSRQERI